MAEALNAPKRKRPDVSARRALQREREYTVVTCSLRSLCRSADVYDGLQAVVCNADRMVREAYHIVNVDTLRRLECGDELPAYDQVYFMRCLAATTSVCGEFTCLDTGLVESARCATLCRPVDYQVPSGRLNSHLREELAVQMKTAMLNHVEVTLFSRLVRYVRSTRGWSRGVASRFVVLAYKPDDPSHDPATHGVFRTEFPVAPNGVEVKARFADAVRSLHHIASVYESMGSTEDLPRAAKMFSIAPVRTRFVPAHIPLTNTVLLELLPPILGVKPKALKETHAADKRAFWDGLFNIRRLETSRRTFDPTLARLSTDGCWVSVYLTVPKAANATTERPRKRAKKKKGAPPDDPAYDVPVRARNIAVDPGCDMLMFGVDDTGATTKCSVREYRHLAKMEEERQRHVRYVQSHEDYAQATTTMPTFKVASLVAYCNALREMHARASCIERHATLRRFRNSKARTKRFGHKALQEVVRRIVGPTPAETCVGLGDWSRIDGVVHGHPPGPVSKLRHALARTPAHLSLLDEFRTSKPCSACGCNRNMINLRGRSSPTCALLRIHGLLRCPSNACGRTWSRDHNSANNLLEIMLCKARGEPRPARFCRG